MKYFPQAWRGGRLLKILQGKDGAVWRPLLFGIPIMVSALALISIHTAATSSSIETDFDSDGMMDAYELFFGLNPTNPADAYLDYDGDHFINLRESAQLTDPFAPDTDRDEFNDDVDANPISRAYIQWGAPQFTTGDQYDYAHPDWFLRAYKTDGEWSCGTLDKLAPPNAWSTNAPQVYDSAWYVPACESNGVGSLSIDLDRAILTNNLRYAVHYLDTGNSSLYVDLLDTNGAVVGAGDLFGNLMTGSNRESIVRLALPLVEFTNAAVVHLRRGTGEVTVFESQLYVDEDGDGLDADQEAQLGTSDYCVDTDGDGISDYEKCFGGGSSTNSPGGDGNDDGRDKDKDKDKDKEKNAKGIIYVDQAKGNDTFTGRAPAISGKKKGPKKTIREGMAAVDADGAHTLVIKSGDYHENLDLRGKNVKVVIEGKVRL